MRRDFQSAYFSYIGETEAPMTFHRWACLSILGAWIGGNYRFSLGHFNIKPNIYVMLMGSAGSRKSTAIKIASKLIAKAGYTNISADRTTKEKFLMDLSGEADIDPRVKVSAKDILDLNLFGGSNDHVAEMLVAADEFNNFVGNGNIEFLSMLGVLWDIEGTYKNKVKNSKSVEIVDPFVSVLAGNTPTGFSLAFPPEAIGQGIFSRLILVHGEATGKRITFPQPPSKEATVALIDLMHAIKQIATGVATITDGAKKLLDAIYKSEHSIPDVRFESYMNRRFTHLVKLCLLCSASALRSDITESDVIYANTILVHAEHTMPKALGEFGKNRNSDVSHKVIQILENSMMPVNIKTLWKQVHNDLTDLDALKDLLSSMTMADKIISTSTGFLIKRNIIDESNSSFVDFSLLTNEERKYVS